MNCIFLLSGDFVDLGKQEVLSLYDVGNSILLGRLLIIDLKNNEKEIKKICKRVALTKNIYKLLFECKINELENSMKNFDWGSVYGKDYCLRITNINDNDINPMRKKSNNVKPYKKIQNKIKKYSEKELAGYIWSSLKNPKVNLENPKTKIELFFAKNKVYCGLAIYINKEDFEARQPHLRPFPHPSSMHPKIARALVNISEIKENKILLDPFCGTGGFLIESGLMKIKSIGYDINKIMISGCKDNLKYFKIKNYEIKHKNALEINDKFDCVVTDPPYGLNSNAILKYEKGWKSFRINKKIETKNFTKNLEKFYLLFLKNLRKKLMKGKKSVIVFPSYVNYKKLLKISKFRIEFEFDNYVHRSLSRKIVKIK